MTGKEVGATCYAAYWHFSGGKSFETGKPMETWQKLDPHVQDAWDAAGHSVLREYALQEQKKASTGEGGSNP